MFCKYLNDNALKNPAKFDKIRSNVLLLAKNAFSWPVFVSLSNKFYVGTRRYGGYLTYRNSSVGTHVGAERYYDPFVRQWKFRPIVMPFVQVSKKFIIELPLVVCKKKSPVCFMSTEWVDRRSCRVGSEGNLKN